MADYTLSAKITGDATLMEKAFLDTQKKLDDMNRKIKESGKLTADSMGNSGKTLKQLAEEQGKTVNDLKSEAMKLASEYKKTGMDMSEAMRKGYEDIGYVSRNTHDKLQNDIDKSGDRFIILSKKLDAISDKFEAFGNKMKNVGFGLGMAGGAMTAAITLPTIKAGKTMVDFDNAMRKAGTIAGATGDQFNELSKCALNLGAKTSLSSSEVAVAMSEMAAKGYDVNQVISAMPGVISAAEASGEDLALTADTIASAINAFGLTAEDSTRVADVLAMSANKTAAGVVDLGYAFKYAAPIASSLGISLEELSAATGIMVDSGLEGQQAGTALRMALTRLVSPTDEAAELLGVLGFSAVDANGNFKPLNQIVSELNGSVEGMTDAQKQAAYATIFGTEAASGMNILLSAGADKLSAFTEELKNSDGASEAAAKSMKDGIGGTLENLSGAIETATITIMNQLAPTIQAIAEKITGLVERFNALPEGTKKMVAFSVGIAAMAGPLLIVFGALFASIGYISNGIGLIVGKFGTLALAIAEAGGASAYFGGILGSIFSPIGIVIMAVIGLVAAFAYLMSTNDEFRESVVNTFNVVLAAVMPVINQIVGVFKTVGNAIMTIITTVLNALAPAFAKIIELIGGLIASIMPVISQVISSVLPVIETIISVIMNVINTIMPGVTAVIDAILAVAEVAIPIIMDIISIASSIFTMIISYLNPVIAFIGMMITTIISIITPIIVFVANVIASIVKIIGTVIGSVTRIFAEVFKLISGTWEKVTSFTAGVFNEIGQVISSISSTVSSVFSKIYEIVSSIMGKVIGFVDGIIIGLRKSWLGLTDFVNGIFKGIEDSIQGLVNNVKGFVNGVIGGINAAIGLINAIPGVKIEAIPYLARGTSNFAGGPARINEGGRGELVILPGGTQVIPHDVSMKYARESAKQTNQGVSIKESGNISVNLNLQAVLETNIQSELDNVATYNQETWRTINTEATAALSTLKTTMDTNFSGITTGLTKSWSENKAVVLSSITSIKNDVSAQVMAMKGQITTDFNAISVGVKKTWLSMETDSKAAWNNIRTGIQGALETIYQTVVSGMKPSLDYIAGLPSMLYSRGKEMIMEMARGINDTKNDVDGAVGGLVDLVINKFREGFKIHSPSRVMYEIGSYLMAGLINSMTDSDLISFTKSMIEDIKGIFMSGNLSTQAVMDIMGPEDGKKLLSEIGAFGVGSGMKWPTDSQDITSLFGYRSAGETGGIGSTDHGGIDIGAAFGSNVYAALSGIVKSAGSMGGYGNAVSLDHGNGFETFYAHMQNVLVEAGQAVSSGQIIGLAGSTGNSTGPHLHYETMQNGGQLDPMQFYTKNAQGMYVGLESVAGAYQNILGDGVERWRSYVVQALAELGLPTSHPYVEATLGQIRNESGGDPFAINLWDSNAMAGYPSQGLLQTIPQTFAAYKRPSARPEDITNGYENIYAAINYATQRYGSILDVWPGAGYANGGIISHEHLAMVGEGGMKEAIIPLDPSKRSRAISLYQQVGDILGFSEGGATQNRNTGYASSARGYRNDDFTSGRDAFSKGDIYQEINIHRPVNSPREMANELKRIEKEIAYGF